jgi:FtsP/CotA-like multicopper oxidase with cupredoxin domain
MSATTPAFTIPRKSLDGEEAEWCKMFDPPTASPPTPEYLAPTNPVPAFMAANVAGATNQIPNTVQRKLMDVTRITMFDGTDVDFYTFDDDPDVPATNGGVWPAPTIRVPRGVIFHGSTSTSRPPHTIHWHGIEPTPMNDGVGHCSMEIGQYTYQWQPNFIGTYFYHCHRNTMQHFEFGLYGMLLIEPPDAFSGPNAGTYPRRTAASLASFPQFPGFVAGDLTSGDPHAYTVPYDVEALWVLDDCDSVWRENMNGPKDTFPAHGLLNPGVDDQFFKGDFHDFNPNYFFVTGLPLPANVGGTGTCDSNFVIPPELNSGVTGMQVPINALRNQTILIRILCAAYINITLTFPTDVVIIAFDGRALGVPPFTQYNHAFLLPAGTPYKLSTARRFDVLMRSASTVNSNATVEFKRTGR